MAEDSLHGERILHSSDDPQPAAAAGAGQDIEVEHAAEETRRVLLAVAGWRGRVVRIPVLVAG